MKKVSILVLVLMAGTMSLFAQNKPESGVHFVVGLEGGLNSLNFNQGDSASAGGTVGFRYKMGNEGLTLRLGAGLRMANNETAFTTQGLAYTNTFKQTNFNLTIGAHKNFAGTDNLETYFGADLSVGTVGGGVNVSRRQVTNNSVVVDPDFFGANNDEYIEITATAPKGMSIGLTPLIGFQYFFVPKLAIGGEFGYGFATTSTKSGESKSESTVGGTTVNTTITANVTDKVGGLSGRGTGRILLAVYF